MKGSARIAVIALMAIFLLGLARGEPAPMPASASVENALPENLTVIALTTSEPGDGSTYLTVQFSATDGNGWRDLTSGHAELKQMARERMVAASDATPAADGDGTRREFFATLAFAPVGEEESFELHMTVSDITGATIRLVHTFDMGVSESAAEAYREDEPAATGPSAESGESSGANGKSEVGVPATSAPARDAPRTVAADPADVASIPRGGAQSRVPWPGVGVSIAVVGVALLAIGAPKR